MSPPPQEGAVSISSSERLLTSLSVLCVTKCPFSVCSDDSLSLPTSFPGTGELSKLDPQTFSDPEILKSCNYVHIYIYMYMYMYVHAIQYVSCSQMLEVVYIISPIVYVRIHCSHMVGCIH